MVNIKELDKNQLEMLRRLVALYIRTGYPVSSRALKRFFGLRMSTANIRKVLHELEELGFLYKPHISAGRVPSDLGYRAYVDALEQMDVRDRALLDKIRVRLGQDWDDIKDLMTRTSQLLSDLTTYMGLIMGVFHPDACIESIKIVKLEGLSGLIVVRLVWGTERKVYVEFPKDYRRDTIHRAELMLNERVSGHPLTEAPDIIDHFLREQSGDEREIAELVSEEREILFDWGYELRFYFRGIEQPIELPEYSDPSILQNLVRLMGERELMLDILKRRLSHDILITIGRENEIEHLSNFSIITRKFVTGGCGGLLGVLGPMRMSYRKVLSVLDGLAEELHRVKIKD